MAYRINDEVEIYGEEDGFQETYYEATIVGIVGEGLYRVRYIHLLTNDGSRPLVEEIWENRIRPRPYTVVVHQFNVGDEVEARYNDGWWIGVISSIDLPTYVVRFRYFPGDYSYEFHELRLHKVKIGRTWTYRREPKAFENDEDVEITLQMGDAPYVLWEAKIVNWIPGGLYRVQFKEQFNTNGEPYEDDIHVNRIRPVPYTIIVDQFTVGDEVDVLQESMWYKGVISAINGDQYHVRIHGLPLEMFYEFADLRIHQHRSGRVWSYVKY